MLTLLQSLLVEVMFDDVLYSSFSFDDLDERILEAVLCLAVTDYRISIEKNFGHCFPF